MRRADRADAPLLAANATNILANFTNYRLGPGHVVIQGNLVGTNAAGTAVFSSGTGIKLAGGSDPSIRPSDLHVVGGTDADDGTIDGRVQARNVIAGNSTTGYVEPYTQITARWAVTAVMG